MAKHSGSLTYPLTLGAEYSLNLLTTLDCLKGWLFKLKDETPQPTPSGTAPRKSWGHTPPSSEAAWGTKCLGTDYPTNSQPGVTRTVLKDLSGKGLRRIGSSTSVKLRYWSVTPRLAPTLCFCICIQNTSDSQWRRHQEKGNVLRVLPQAAPGSTAIACFSKTQSRRRC